MFSYLRYKLEMIRWWWEIPSWYEWRYKRKISMDTWHILNERWWAKMPKPPEGKDHWSKLYQEDKAINALLEKEK